MIIQFAKRRFIHLIILVLLIGYLIAVDPVYVAFFLRHGKPIAINPSLPRETNNFDVNFGDLQPIRYDGQDLFELTGYGLHHSLPHEEHHIKIILHSTSRDILFDTDRPAVSRVIVNRPDFVKTMRFAEFRMMFSKEVLPVDNYRIGIIIEDLKGNVLGYKLTNSYIERQPNKIRFIYGK